MTCVWLDWRAALEESWRVNQKGAGHLLKRSWQELVCGLQDGWREASQLERAHASRAHTVRAVLQEAQEPEDSRSTAYKDLFADPVDVKLIMSGAPPSRPLDLLRTHELLLIVVASAGPRFAKLQSLLTRFLRKPSAALFRAFAESGVLGRSLEHESESEEIGVSCYGIPQRRNDGASHSYCKAGIGSVFLDIDCIHCQHLLG